MCVSSLVRATIRSEVFALAAALLSAGSVNAQDAPAHLAYVDGAVSLDRDSETFVATSGEPFLPGDRLRTASGLAEVWFPDGSTLDLDAYTTAELDSPSLLRLTAGRVILVVTRGVESTMAASYRVDTPWGAAITAGPGEYRVSLTAGEREGSVELAVVRGTAQLSSDRGSTSIRSGQRAFVSADGAPSRPEIFNDARMDTFSRWASSRRDERLGQAASARYLPTNLQIYGGTFDRYGAWDDDADNGYVWYPTVDPDWRPYFNGYWSPLPTYGWTWIGLDQWGWPTHHYGRWGFARSRWFWIPERRWAPAWVSWATAPGYVSWCPIGRDNRPVFGLSTASGNRWAGWVVLPRSSFGARNLDVNRYAIEGRRLPRNTSLVAHPQPPSLPAFRRRENVGAPRPGVPAVPRESRGAAERLRAPVDGRTRPTGSGSERDRRTTAAAPDTTPQTRDSTADDRPRAYRSGPERPTPAQGAPAGTPRVDRQRPPTSRDREATGSGRVAPPDPRATAPGRAAVPERQGGGIAAREAGPRAQPRDRAAGSRPTYSSPPAVAPATPAAPPPRAAPRADRDPREQGTSRPSSGDRPNRRGADGAGAPTPRPAPPPQSSERAAPPSRPAERGSPPPRPAERASPPPRQPESAPPPRESARPAPAREAPATRAQPRSERSSGAGDGGGAARGREGGGGAQGRRSP